MAHFARLEGDVVTQVIVVANEVILRDGVESEQAGIEFCRSLFGQESEWRQTSYNANFRGVYAGIGFRYDAEADVFVAPG